MRSAYDRKSATIIRPQDDWPFGLPGGYFNARPAILVSVLFVLCVPLALSGSPRKSPISHARRYTIRDLGELPPRLEIAGRGTEAAAINARGQVVGASNGRAFLWEQGRMRDLGALPGDNLSLATAINNRGDVLCESSLKSSYQAILWSGGRLRKLGTLGGLESSAEDVNSRQQVVGDSTTPPDREGRAALHPFLWENGRMTDLGVLPGCRRGYARAISETGAVVGFCIQGERGSERYRAFVWQAGKMTELPLLPGYLSTIARSVNTRGQIVGAALNRDGIDWDGRAALWNKGRITDLGTLGGKNSDAVAINESGHIAGQAQDAEGRWHQVRWVDGQIEDLGMVTERRGQSWVRGINNRDEILNDVYPTKSGEPIRSLIWSHGATRPVALPPGQTSSQTTRINDRGAVVGDAGVAFLSEGDSARDMTALLKQRGLRLTALNNQGDVVGMIGFNAPEYHEPVPFLFRDGRRIPLGTLGGDRVNARSLNDRGQVVGASLLGPNAKVPFHQHAFLWQTGKMTDLDGVPESDSAAWFIDNHGRILGSAQNAGVFFWGPGGKRTPVAEEAEQVTAMNQRGQWCGSGFGGAYRPNPSASMMSRTHAMLWDRGRKIVLSQPGATNETATALNNRGQVVRQGEDGAFLWEPGRRVDLQKLLPPGSGWKITSVTGINDRGQIVGSGSFQGRTRAFLMTPK